MSAGFQRPFLSSPLSSERGKVVSAREAVRLIRPGDTVATGGFVGIGFAEEIAIALEALYLEENKSTGDFPRDLTLVYAGGQGDGKSKGLNHMAHVGLVRRVIGGQSGAGPRPQRRATVERREW